MAQERGATPTPPNLDELHWASRLGFRSLRVQQGIAVINRVVLVPDEATYLDELSKWSIADGIWPVLFEDEEHLARMFIRRFQPEQVVRREPVRDARRLWPADVDERWRVLNELRLRFWRRDPGQTTLADAMGAHGLEPTGAVFTSTDDSSWTGAIALAIARGQLLERLDGDYSRPNLSISTGQQSEIDATIRTALTQSGLAFDELGDVIDAVTLCRFMAGRVLMSAPGAQPREFTAVTDALGRDPDGTRYAFVGWMYGSEARSAYNAMCSLFLPRTDVTYFNTYPTDGAWGQYDVVDAAAMITPRGFSVDSKRAEQAHLAVWRRLLAGGSSTDVFFINSKGNADFFDFADGRGYPNDVPILETPAAVHMIHSWSFRSPEAGDTVGGVFLEHGAYAYVGSVQEPYLQAFVPPSAIAQRTVAGVPFMIAARHWDAKPWKINTYGDPLMMLGPTPERTKPGPHEGINLRDEARAALQGTKGAQSGRAFAEAIRLLSLLGEDTIALNAIELAKQRNQLAACAAEALPVLFRLQQTELFIEAFMLTRQRNERMKTMLWHLVAPRLEGRADPDLVVLLASNLRQPLSHADLERLLPAMQSAFDAAYARRTIQNELNRTQNVVNRRNLERLLRQIR